MKDSLFQFLCCPNCGHDLHIDNVKEAEGDEIIQASLSCEGCKSPYAVSNGIPILLPHNFSNGFECDLRKRVSNNALKTSKKCISLYDMHHFRELAQLGTCKYLKTIHSERPKVMDIGIGWGIKYLPFIANIDLWGIDFSFESLLVAKEIYKNNNKTAPNLICASLSSIPIKNIKYDLIWSTQVYQHIPKAEEVKASFDNVIKNLLNSPGTFIVDNFNYNYVRFSPKNMIKSLFKHAPIKQECKQQDSLYLKYYLDKDFELLMGNSDKNIKYYITFTENLFHPEYNLIPKTKMLAKFDDLLSRSPFAGYLGRQITLIVNKLII